MQEQTVLNLRYFKAREKVKQDISMTNKIMIKEIIRIGIDQNSGDRRIQYGQNYRGRARYEQKYTNDVRRGNFRDNMRTYQNQNFRKQNNRGGI